MLRHSPRRRPFPYTTLFRSTGASLLVVQADIASPAAIPTSVSSLRIVHPPGISLGRTITTPPLQANRRRRRTDRFARSNNQDRKSTRLNSSHSQISYAVFCL